MKTALHYIFITALFALVMADLQAREMEITPFYGYQFGGSVNTTEGELRVKDSEVMGFTFDVKASSKATIQFYYSNQDSVLEVRRNSTGVTEDLTDLSVQYYQIGGTSEISSSQKTTSFVSGSLGATYFKPDDSRFSSETLFSLVFGLGVKRMINKSIGFNVQGRLLLPIQYAGGSLFCGSSGCAGSVSGGTSIVQGNVTAGLVVRFGK